MVGGKMTMECSADAMDDNMTRNDFMLDKTDYFYQGCSWSRSDVIKTMIDCLNRSDQLNSNPGENITQCAQFCRSFRDTLPHVYGAFSCVSLLCCLGVFVTYYTFPRLQQSGYSSKVFIRRYIHYLYIFGTVVSKIVV